LELKSDESGLLGVFVPGDDGHFTALFANVVWFCATEKPRIELITVEMATDSLFNRDC